MAKNREPVKHDESESDSSEEERDEGSSEEVDSQEVDSETEPTPVLKEAPSPISLSQQKKVQPHAAGKSQPAGSSSEEGDESGSESESESDGPDAQKSNIGAKKPLPKPNVPAKSTVTKRTVNDKAADAKKTEPETEIKPNDDSKKSPFQRLWSEDDEIVILKGMIEYTSKKKSEPGADLNAFHDFIKKNLHIDVSRSQLQDKIRKLKKKYVNNRSKEKEGKDRAFSKPHEQKVYQLSKDIWGNDESGGEKRAGNPKANAKKAPVIKAANVPDSEEAKASKKLVAVSDEGEKKPPGKRLSTSVEDRIIASGVEYFEAGKGMEGEREWKKLRVEEIELHLKLLEVRKAQTKLLLDVLKSEEY